MKPLIASLLAALSLSACVVTPPTPPQSLTLTTTQQTNLRTLLGLTPSSAFTVNVLDQNNDRVLSPGDLAIMYGGITNTETSRRTLSAADITTITTTPASDDRVMCTMEAKICPNGGAVGRVAPHCEFAPCPEK
jgi:hypothetical protein